MPTVDGNVITVAAAENTTTAAITGTLTVNLMKGVQTVDTKTVSMTQAAPASGNVVTITSAEIAEMSNQAYGEFDFTNGFGTWTGRCAITAKGTDAPYLQLNFNNEGGSAANSHILIPELPGAAQSVEIELSTKTYFPRAVGIYAADYSYDGGSKENPGTSGTAHDAAALAMSNKTTEKGGTLMIDVSALNLKQFSLYPSSDGAVYIRSITITYAK